MKMIIKIKIYKNIEIIMLNEEIKSLYLLIKSYNQINKLDTYYIKLNIFI